MPGESTQGRSRGAATRRMAVGEGVRDGPPGLVGPPHVAAPDSDRNVSPHTDQRCEGFGVELALRVGRTVR